MKQVSAFLSTLVLIGLVSPSISIADQPIDYKQQSNVFAKEIASMASTRTCLEIPLLDRQEVWTGVESRTAYRFNLKVSSLENPKIICHTSIEVDRNGIAIIGDERYDEILAWAAGQKAISASLIQRRFKLGYPRAARLTELFEKEGVVGPANGSKPRTVLVNNLNG